jgi:hypothetical protein
MSNAWRPEIHSHEPAGEKQKPEKPKAATPKGGNTVVIGACLIAAVKMAQDRSWDLMAHSPKIIYTISQALTIAKKIYDRAVDDYPGLF